MRKWGHLPELKIVDTGRDAIVGFVAHAFLPIASVSCQSHHIESKATRPEKRTESTRDAIKGANPWVWVVEFKKMEETE